MNKLKIILQCVLGLIPLMISIVLPVELLWESLSLAIDRDLSNFKKMIYELVPSEKILSLILGLICTIILFGVLRLINKNKTFNLGNDYFDYHMAYFAIASLVLGYKRITLVKIPVYLQFKLIFKDMFEYMDPDIHSEEIDEPKVIIKYSEVESNEINLVLSDTYQIHLDELPFEKKKLPTVLIERTNGFTGVRTYNKRFTDVIREQTNKYRLQYERVNIFATTNTQHTKEIVLQSFKNGGRTGFKKIYVYEQGSNRKFEKPHQLQ